MAIKDITERDDLETGLDFAQTSPYFYKTRVIDFSQETELGTQAIHPILDVNVGEALKGFDLIIQTTLAGATGTLTFQTSHGTPILLSTAIVGTTLEAGQVLQFGTNVRAGTGFDIVGSADTYAHTTAYTLDMEVATADLTAGRFLFVAQFYRNLDKFLPAS